MEGAGNEVEMIEAYKKFYGWEKFERNLEESENLFIDILKNEKNKKIEKSFSFYLLSKIELIQNKNLSKSIEYLKEASLLGNSNAKHKLGKIYREGNEEINKDSEKMLSYFKEAAELGFHISFKNCFMGLT